MGYEIETVEWEFRLSQQCGIGDFAPQPITQMSVSLARPQYSRCLGQLIWRGKLERELKMRAKRGS